MTLTDYLGLLFISLVGLTILSFVMIAITFMLREAINAKRWRKCLHEARKILQKTRDEFPGCEKALNMYLEQRFTPFNPPSMNLATSTILGTSQQWSVERTWPIEELVLNILFTVTTALAPTVAGTTDSYDGILNLAQRITFAVNDGRVSRNTIDVSGVGLLEYLTQAAFNLDSGTNHLIGLVNAGVNIPTGQYQLSYRIPMVDPMIGEGLRSRMYLPVHKFSQDPVLKITFNTLANMGYGSGVIGNVYVETQLIRRVPTANSEAKLINTAPRDQGGIFKTGYIPFDLVETQYALPIGQNAEVKLDIPLPGSYVLMVVRQYRGGSTISRNVVDNSGIGDTVANGFGNETQWRMEVGGGTIRSWRWRQLRTNNDSSRPIYGIPENRFVAATSAGSPTSAMNTHPNFGLTISGNLRAACSTSLNFLLDGMSNDTGTELGSLLDANTPQNSGTKVQIIGTPASVATNASIISIVARRLLGDISAWQVIP